MRNYLPTLSRLKDITANATNITATTAASAAGGYAFYGVGGAYGSTAARAAADWLIPSMPSTGGFVGAAKAFAWNNVAKKSAVEAIGYQGFAYGATAGAAAGGLIGAAAIQLGLMAAQESINYAYNKHNAYQEHKKISREYMDLAKFNKDCDIFQSLGTEPGYVHVSVAPRRFTV